MTNLIADPATLEANPADGTIPAEADPQTLDGSTPPAASQPTTEPDEAYKGLQRRLDREQKRARELEAALARASGQGVDAQSAQVIQALIAEISQSDPAKGALLRQEYEKALLAQENFVLRTRQQQEDNATAIKQAEERTLQELRATVIAFGANPESPLIDYGDASEPFVDRLSRVREDAKRASAPATPVTPAVRSVGAGTSHNVQPGTPAPATTPTREVTDEDVRKAQLEYTRVMNGPLDAAARAEATAKLRTVNDAYAKQVFS